MPPLIEEDENLQRVIHLEVNRQSSLDSSDSISFEQSSPSVISFDWNSVDKEERILRSELVVIGC